MTVRVGCDADFKLIPLAWFILLQCLVLSGSDYFDLTIGVEAETDGTVAVAVVDIDLE